MRIVALGRLAAAMWLAGCTGEPPSPWDVDGDRVVRVAILGDSNSSVFSVPDGKTIWWQRLQEALDAREPGVWRIDSRARLGAVLGSAPNHPEREGRVQIAEVLAQKPPPDVVLVALGTNDLMAGEAPVTVAETIAFAVRRLEASGARLLVAHVPPCWKRRCRPNAVYELNRLVDAVLPDVPKVDFWTGVTPADMQPDGLHFTAAGHAKRRDVVLAVLRAGPLPAGVHGLGKPAAQN